MGLGRQPRLHTACTVLDANRKARLGSWCCAALAWSSSGPPRGLGASTPPRGVPRASRRPRGRAVELLHGEDPLDPQHDTQAAALSGAPRRAIRSSSGPHASAMASSSSGDLRLQVIHPGIHRANQHTSISWPLTRSQSEDSPPGSAVSACGSAMESSKTS